MIGRVLLLFSLWMGSLPAMASAFSLSLARDPLADQSSSCALKADFLLAPSDGILSSLPVYMRAFEATPLIVYESKKGPGGCSSTYISEQGHLLTAAHCVRECLVREGVFKEKTVLETELASKTSDANEAKSDGSDQLDSTGFVLDPTRLGSARCDIYIRGRGTVSATVVAASRCNLPAKAFDRVAKGERTNEPACDRPEDFVVLKAEPATPEAKTPCLMVQSGPPAESTRYWALGWPFQTRRGEMDSDGRNKQISVGELNTSGRCELDPRNIKGKRRSVALNGVPPGSHYLTVDSVGRNSGSGLLDLDGRVAGIITAGEGKDDAKSQEIECRGSTITQGADLIRESVRLQVSPETYRDVFSCIVTPSRKEFAL